MMKELIADNQPIAIALRIAGKLYIFISYGS
jgi:hypothetical protein